MGDINQLCMNCFEEGLREGSGLCAKCGAPAVAMGASLHHLPPRSILAGKYMISRVLGEGGFGITYLGWDINLEVKVAIKEYFPLGAATRSVTASYTVATPGGNTHSLYLQGQERFLDEARRLAKLAGLPGIVLVKDFFQENGTAYIVMEFVEGITFKSWLDEAGGRLPAQQVLALFQPLIQSLGQVHEAGIIHRDISPDNIMLTGGKGAGGAQLRLIDFGAARNFDDNNASLSVLLKPGYAPEEQYRSRGNQGPWTDIYALCATLYRAIEGEKPPEALERVLQDELRAFSVPIAPQAAQAILTGLAVRQENRWQSTEDLFAALYGSGAAGQNMASPGQMQGQGQTPAAPPLVPVAKPEGGKPPKPMKRLAPILIAVALVLAVAIGIAAATAGGGQRGGAAVARSGSAPTGSGQTGEALAEVLGTLVAARSLENPDDGVAMGYTDITETYRAENPSLTIAWACEQLLDVPTPAGVQSWALLSQRKGTVLQHGATIQLATAEDVANLHEDAFNYFSAIYGENAGSIVDTRMRQSGATGSTVRGLLAHNGLSTFSTTWENPFDDADEIFVLGLRRVESLNIHGWEDQGYELYFRFERPAPEGAAPETEPAQATESEAAAAEPEAAAEPAEGEPTEGEPTEGA